MKCNDCPFSLPCWAGRLDGDDAEIELCVHCGNLGVTRHTEDGIIVSYFKCEQRPRTDEMYDTWCRRLGYSPTTKGHLAPPAPRMSTRVAELRWPDPVGTISGTLRLRECAVCNPNSNGQRVFDSLSPTAQEGSRVYFHYRLLDEEMKDNATDRHVWSLTPTR